MAKNIQALKKGTQLFFVVLMLVVFVGNAQAAETIKLKLSYPVPATGVVGKGYEYFAKAVKEESGGQVVVQTYPSASLVTDREALDAVRKGNVDIAHNMVAYATQTIKEFNPLVVPGCYLASKYNLVHQKLDPLAQKIYAQYDVRFLGSFFPGTMTFNAAKKVKKVIKTPADMKGLTIRSYGKWLSMAIMKWGGTPATVPLGDMAVALDRGTISVIFTAWMIADSVKLHEQAPYISYLDVCGPYQGLMMSEKAWGRLNGQQKEAVERAVKKWQNQVKMILQESFKKYEQTIKNAGTTTYTLSKEENSAFLKVVDPLMEEVKKVSGPGGAEVIQVLSGLR